MASKRYLAKVRRRLTCSAASRRRLLAQAEQMVEDFLQENPGADGDALAVAFGAPEEFAGQMLDTLEPGEVAAAQKRRRLAARVSVAAIVLALVVTNGLYLFQYLRIHQIIDGKFIFIESPGRNITKEEYDTFLVAAAGQEAVGNCARWTSEAFYFLPALSQGAEASGDLAAFRQALEACGLPVQLAPTWVPDGFRPKEPQVWVDDAASVVDVAFQHEDGRCLSISVERYADEKDITAAAYEKDDTPVVVYIQNGRKFYIISNGDSVCATWTDGALLETITGQISIDKVKTMIDSIGR